MSWAEQDISVEISQISVEEMGNTFFIEKQQKS